METTIFNLYATNFYTIHEKINIRTYYSNQQPRFLYPYISPYPAKYRCIPYTVSIHIFYNTINKQDIFNSKF